MRIYNLVKKLLEENIELRNDDQLLQWKVWEIEGSVKNGCMYYSDFKNATNPESIRRARQLVVAEHPELQANETVRKLRHKKELEKGTFGFRQTIEEKPKWEYNPTTGCYNQV